MPRLSKQGHNMFLRCSLLHRSMNLNAHGLQIKQVRDQLKGSTVLGQESPRFSNTDADTSELHAA